MRKYWKSKRRKIRKQTILDGHSFVVFTTPLPDEKEKKTSFGRNIFSYGRNGRRACEMPLKGAATMLGRVIFYLQTRSASIYKAMF